MNNCVSTLFLLTLAFCLSVAYSAPTSECTDPEMVNDYSVSKNQLVFRKMFEAQIIVKAKIAEMDEAKGTIKATDPCFFKGSVDQKVLQIDRVGKTTCIDNTHVQQKLAEYQNNKETTFIFMVKRVYDRFEVLDAGVYDNKIIDAALLMICDLNTTTKAHSCFDNKVIKPITNCVTMKQMRNVVFKTIKSNEQPPLHLIIGGSEAREDDTPRLNDGVKTDVEVKTDNQQSISSNKTATQLATSYSLTSLLLTVLCWSLLRRL